MSATSTDLSSLIGIFPADDSSEAGLSDIIPSSSLPNPGQNLGTPVAWTPQSLNTPGLPDISGAGPLPSGGLATAVGSAVASAASNALTGGLTSGLFTGGVGLERIVSIIIGLILIAGGIFLFRPVRDTVVQVGKTAAKAAA
jgi:hypothetical protein